MAGALTLLSCLLVVAPRLESAPKKATGPEVIVVADRMVESTQAPRPTPEKPVYYFLLGGKEKPMGDAIAGEPMPTREEMVGEVVAALATQGYRRTQLGGPAPTQAVVFSFGTANLSSLEMMEDDGTASTVGFNQREIRQLVGADKLAPSPQVTTAAERILDASREDRVCIYVAAFDAVALAKKKKVLLWRTRVSIDSQRRTLPESLKVMLASAAPHFGTQADLPVIIEDADRQRTDVQVGAPVVVPISPPTKP